MNRVARSFLPLGAFVFVAGIATVALGATVGHGSIVPISIGEIAIFLGLMLATVGTLAWVVTRRR